MIVVSDASPLINLARINSLDLLRQMYPQVIVPRGVWTEVVIDGAGRPGAEEIRAADWIQARQPANDALVRILRQELDAGEAEAIALALELPASLLLMDERLGREVAAHLSLNYIGLVGMLVEARHKRIIEAIKPYLDRLRDSAGFRISEPLYSRVLRDAGEAV